jgi:hypothetical protein
MYIICCCHLQLITSGRVLSRSRESWSTITQDKLRKVLDQIQHLLAGRNDVFLRQQKSIASSIPELNLIGPHYLELGIKVIQHASASRSAREAGESGTFAGCSYFVPFAGLHLDSLSQADTEFLQVFEVRGWMVAGVGVWVENWIG